MKIIVTIIVILFSTLSFAQEKKGNNMVLIENYPISYDTVLTHDTERILRDIRTRNIRRNYPQRQNRELFIRGNFNKDRVNINIIQIQNNIDNNIYNYQKSTRFDPDKSLKEIVRDL